MGTTVTRGGPADDQARSVLAPAGARVRAPGCGRFGILRHTCSLTKGRSVAIPDIQSLMRPCLAVHEDGQPHSTVELRDRLAEIMDVSTEDRKRLLPSGSKLVFSNRVAWAITHLAQAGLLERLGRGITQITDRGRTTLKTHPDRVNMTVLLSFPEYVEFRMRTRERKGKSAETAETVSSAQDLSPREAITEAIDTAHSAVSSDLVSRIIKQPPAFLEQLVLKLLAEMGYGGLEAPGEHLGGSNDAGLDGLIRLDPLGLDIVYVQAKRYTDQHVGRPEIQAFVGALHGAQASRGVFITTSRFTAGARDYADRVNARLVLIDGPELASPMIEYDCGVVTEENFVLKQVDENFFDQP